MNSVVVITAVGQDRPGIVAALAKAMFDLGGNLDDATMTRLHSAFATMVSASLPVGVNVDDCRAALAPVAREMGLTVTVQEVNGEDGAETPPDHLITVYGADKAGIVFEVTARLAERGVNITDMDTRLTGAPGSPIYVMVLEVACGDTDLASEIETLRKTLGVDITVQSLDAEAL
jgi:glycine cleavage system transcriptional repressor